MTRYRSFALIFAGLGILSAAGCTTSAREIRDARQSGYMTDFAVVYSAALAATQEKYPTINESPTTQLIATAWHPLKLSSGTVDDSQSGLQGNRNTGNRNTATSNTVRTRYFVRFRVYVVGGKPFRVRIEGEASEWTEGEIPTPLRGAEIPSWLGARTDALRVSIHRRLKAHAVPLKPGGLKKKTAAGVPLPDNKSFGELPAGAGDVVALVSQAAEGRDHEALRNLVTTDVQWARGSRGVDAAIAIWAADSQKLAQLAALLTKGCAVDDGNPLTAVVCPGAVAKAPGFRGLVARFSQIDGAWKLISFFEE